MESRLKKYAVVIGYAAFLAAVIATLVVMFSATSSEGPWTYSKSP